MILDLRQTAPDVMIMDSSGLAENPHFFFQACIPDGYIQPSGGTGWRELQCYELECN